MMTSENMRNIYENAPVAFKEGLSKRNALAPAQEKAVKGHAQPEVHRAGPVQQWSIGTAKTTNEKAKFQAIDHICRDGTHAATMMTAIDETSTWDFQLSDEKCIYTMQDKVDNLHSVWSALNRIFGAVGIVRNILLINMTSFPLHIKVVRYCNERPLQGAVLRGSSWSGFVPFTFCESRDLSRTTCRRDEAQGQARTCGQESFLVLCHGTVQCLRRVSRHCNISLMKLSAKMGSARLSRCDTANFLTCHKHSGYGPSCNSP